LGPPGPRFNRGGSEVAKRRIRGGKEENPGKWAFMRMWITVESYQQVTQISMA
jgi:hypothetical protein